TKIAGAAFNAKGEMLHQEIVSTPKDYDMFLDAVAGVVSAVEMRTERVDRIGVSTAGMIDQETGVILSASIPCTRGKTYRDDIAIATGRETRLANDASCMTLAEAIDGAGKGYPSVLGLILGTGIGSGFVVNQQIVDGPNGLTGEIGHLPLAFREEGEGEPGECVCGQSICMESLVAGPALKHLYTKMTGKVADNPQIATLASTGDAAALAVLDRYYEMLAKAMITAIHSFDPHVIVVSGGLMGLPGLYDAVPAKWSKYCLAKPPKTKFVSAKHGPIAGLRGAASLWRGMAFEG
ncbi:MAG TPA: fructokinase, partial [Rhodospirillaceae bacterium]|nr:fructokinase [Rhodospirillaceae bacterium]